MQEAKRIPVQNQPEGKGQSENESGNSQALLFTRTITARPIQSGVVVVLRVPQEVLQDLKVFQEFPLDSLNWARDRGCRKLHNILKRPR